MNKNYILCALHRSSNRGAALVIVLSTLVLLVGLVVAILTRVTSARAVSSSYSTGVTNRVLADTAVNMVVGQIQDATSDTTQKISWASQPGAIRNYDLNGFKKGYKLFSSSKMQSTDQTELTQTVDPAWRSKPGQYVNLNLPVTKNGTKVYPIADPDILAENADSPDYVEGFSVTDKDYRQNLEMPVEWLYVRKDGTIASGQYSSDTGVVNLSGASMEPVVARIAFWTDDESAKVNINTASEGLYWDTPHINTMNGTQNPASSYVSSSNVMTTKVNDTEYPRYIYAPTSLDAGLAFNQPARNEFNRFPGHPAMTSLSAVFPFLTPNQIFQLAPRVQGSGSTMGTMSTVEKYQAINGYADGDRLYDSPAELAIRSIPFDLARPNPGPTEGRLPNGENIVLPNGGTDSSAVALKPAQVRKRSFLLTASSRSPELNLFGRPRVVMWPTYPSKLVKNPDSVANGKLARTPFDELIAFCGTLRANITEDPDKITDSETQWPFVFFRKYAYKGDDQNTPRSANNDDGRIPSNIKLFNYLHDVTSKPTPGFGASLASKYRDGSCDEILAEMLDYIRCTNVFDTFLEGDNYKAEDQTTGGEYTNGTFGGGGLASTHGKPGRGQVVPLTIGGFRGLGRTPTVSEVALHLICTADYDEGGLYAYLETLRKSDSQADKDKYRQLASNTDENITLGAARTLLGPNQKRIQAMLHVELATPMNGYPTIANNLEVEILNANGFKVNGTQLFDSKGSLKTFNYNPIRGANGFNREGDTHWQGVATGGYLGMFPFVFMGRFPGNTIGLAENRLQADKITTIDRVGDLVNNPFVSNPFTVASDVPLNITGANLTINLYYPPDGSNRNAPRQLYQTLMVNFPQSMTTPVPNLDRGDSDAHRADYNGGGGEDKYRCSWAFNQDGYHGPGGNGHTNPAGRFSTLRDPLHNQIGVNYILGPLLFLRQDPATTTGNIHGLLQYDVVRSMQLRDGDFRFTSQLQNVPSEYFVQTKLRAGDDFMAHSLTNPYYFQFIVTNFVGEAKGAYETVLDRKNGRSVGIHPGSTIGNPVPVEHGMDIPSTSDYVGPSNQTASVTGDWDNGIGNGPDGPFSNMPDAGDFVRLDNNRAPYPPYFFFPDQDTGAMAKGFSPNRQIPSSGMFGSLPTGSKNGSWRTLLFRPGNSNHPAYVKPGQTSVAPDHLFMDLFWMPIVQPYAISEPFSTAGKINMNYQILPFTYIKRQTGMRAVLKAERMLAIPSTAAPTYRNTLAIQSYPTTWRPAINMDQTLKQFDDKFASNNIFRSATEICEQQLVPDDVTNPGLTAASMDSYWTNHSLTGDNAKERPYANIYPRLTTQSNTYQVHYMVQTVKQVGDHPKTFVDPDSVTARNTGGQLADVVTGQLRGSRLIERYLNSTDARFTSGTGTDQVNTINPRQDSLNGAYKMRVYGATVFPP